MPLDLDAYLDRIQYTGRLSWPGQGCELVTRSSWRIGSMNRASMPPGSHAMSTDTVRTEVATFCFAVRAAADPGTLTRLIAPFAKRGLVPTSVVARSAGADGAILLVDLQVGGLDRALAEMVAEGLRQLVPVERVLLAELALAVAA